MFNHSSQPHPWYRQVSRCRPSEYINYGQISSSKCFGGVQSSSGTGSSLYGDVFLKSQFVVFDGSDTPRLGLLNVGGLIFDIAKFIH
jgi:hypothetical protein